jgi:hypothetical protein
MPEQTYKHTIKSKTAVTELLFSQQDAEKKRCHDICTQPLVNGYQTVAQSTVNSFLLENKGMIKQERQEQGSAQS